MMSGGSSRLPRPSEPSSPRCELRALRALLLAVSYYAAEPRILLPKPGAAPELYEVAFDDPEVVYFVRRVDLSGLASYCAEVVLISEGAARNVSVGCYNGHEELRFDFGEARLAGGQGRKLQVRVTNPTPAPDGGAGFSIVVTVRVVIERRKS